MAENSKISRKEMLANVRAKYKKGLEDVFGNAKTVDVLMRILDAYLEEDLKPISRLVPDMETLKAAIVRVMSDDSYLVGSLDAEEIDIGVKAREGLMYASSAQLGEAMTGLIANGKVQMTFAAKAGERLKAFFSLTEQEIGKPGERK